MPTHLPNEAALVSAAKAGDTTAFTTLVRQYDRNIYRLALNITGNKDAVLAFAERSAPVRRRIALLHVAGSNRRERSADETSPPPSAARGFT